MAQPNRVAVPHDASDPQQARQFAVQVRRRLDYLELGILNPTTGAPADTPTAGTARFDKATKRLWIFDGTVWRYTTLT